MTEGLWATAIVINYDIIFKVCWFIVCYYIIFLTGDLYFVVNNHKKP